MLKYFKRKSPESGEGNSQPSKQCHVEINAGHAANMNPSVVINVADIPSSPIHVEINMAGIPSNPTREEINLADLPSDPGLRCCILDYHPNDRDQVRRAYLQKGPCQPRDHQFPQTQFGPKLRRFNKNWFRKFPTWLEYSVEKNAAYCLCCYLFKPEVGDQSGGESFVGEGFSNWKKNDRIQVHVGGPNSAHNQAWGKCQDLVNQRQHIQTVFDNQSNQTRTMYRIRLNASIDCIRFLLKQGLSFRGHDKKKLICLAEFYPREFSPIELMVLHDQLDTYICDMLSDNRFLELNGVTDLCKKMVETGKGKVYPLVYLLLTLALLLPVATATVERVFSAMNIVKNRLRNRMTDQWLNASLVVYIERDIFAGIDNETIMRYFQNMQTRRGQL